MSGGPSSECSSLEAKVYVNAGSGSDSNPGTADKPFKTLNKGFSVALANRGQGKGTCVLLQPGTYRKSLVERIEGGSSGKRIVIESVVPGEAVISGSDVWTGWSCSSGVCEKAWPYDWGTSTETDGQTIGKLALRREMVFVNGKNLNQFMTKAELTSNENGSFSVDEGANKIYVKLPSGVDINKATVEVAVRDTLFKTSFVDDLTLRGLVFQHSAAGFKKDGAVTLYFQKRVTLDNVTVEWNGNRGLFLTSGSDYTIRNTTMKYNGSSGLEGNELIDLLMEDTESSYNNWRGARGGYYTWTIEKFLHVHGALIKRHKAVHNFSRGLWFDSDMMDVVIEDAYSCDNRSDGLHIEAVQGPVTVRNSTFCDNDEHGVHLLASVGVILENNTISGNDWNAIEVVGGGRDRVNFKTGEKYKLYNKDLTVRNNRISSSAVHPDKKKGLLWRVGLYGSEFNDFKTTSTFGDNIYTHSSTDTGKVFGISEYSYGDPITFGEWKNKMGQDSTSTFSY